MGLLGGVSSGWQSVGFGPDRIDVAHVIRTPGGKPRLARLESYARTDGDAKALSALRKKRVLSGAACSTILSPGEYVFAQIEAPNVPEAELVSAVRWSLRDMLDYPVENATIDVARIVVEQSGGRHPQLFAVAANNTLLAPRIQAFDLARLSLKVIDIPEMAQRNLAALVEEENRGLAMLSFDAAGGLLTFTNRGDLILARRVDISTQQLLTTDPERRSAYFDRIGLELQRSLDNFERMYTSVSVSKVVLGPGLFTEELIVFLRDYVYIPVEAMDLTALLDCAGVPEIRHPDLQAERLILIGAALRDENGVGS